MTVVTVRHRTYLISYKKILTGFNPSRIQNIIINTSMHQVPMIRPNDKQKLAVKYFLHEKRKLIVNNL